MLLLLLLLIISSIIYIAITFTVTIIWVLLQFHS